MISNVSLDGYEIDYIDMTIKGCVCWRKPIRLVGPLDSLVDRTAGRNTSRTVPYFLSGKITAAQMWKTTIENGIILDD